MWICSKCGKAGSPSTHVCQGAPADPASPAADVRARIGEIRTKADNAALDWRLQSDEPCDLIDDLRFVLDLLAAQEAQIRELREALEASGVREVTGGFDSEHWKQRAESAEAQITAITRERDRLKAENVALNEALSWAEKLYRFRRGESPR